MEPNDIPPSTPLILTPPPQLLRGPMYSAYSELREARLRTRLFNSEDDHFLTTPPPKKTPAVCQSVPSLSAALRKENRRPTASPLLPVPPKRVAATKTPPASLPPSSSVLRRSGSMSTGRGEERRNVEAKARRSYACLKELKGFPHAASKEDNGRWDSNRGTLQTRISGASTKYI